MNKETQKLKIQELNDRIAKLETKHNQDNQDNQDSPIQKIFGKTLEWGETCNQQLNWDNAMKWCKEKDGWRAPTVVELLQAYYDKVPGFEPGYYWSSANAKYSDSIARYIHFSSGSTSFGGKKCSNYVRRVREID